MFYHSMVIQSLLRNGNFALLLCAQMECALGEDEEDKGDGLMARKKPGSSADSNFTSYVLLLSYSHHCNFAVCLPNSSSRVQVQVLFGSNGIFEDVSSKSGSQL